MNGMILRSAILGAIMMSLAIPACTERRERADDTRSDSAPPSFPATQPPDRTPAPESAAPRPSPFEMNPVIPGERMGKIEIGEDVDAVARVLGRSDSGDAAMGHAWQFWFSKGSAEGERNLLGVYTVLNDSATHHEVREILVTSPRFTTAEGIHVGGSLEAILKAFPGARRTGEHTPAGRGGKALRVYDDVERGIAFLVEPGGEPGSGHAVAIIVHRGGDEVAREYIPL